MGVPSIQTRAHSAHNGAAARELLSRGHEREIDALKQRLEEKDELLFVSDRVLHRLFKHDPRDQDAGGTRPSPSPLPCAAPTIKLRAMGQQLWIQKKAIRRRSKLNFRRSKARPRRRWTASCAASAERYSKTSLDEEA
ncbi:hypothetical protein L1887_50711 [Cichorium endivia]|nr:hypothetical protein L1887_50711 [Cichorium endivia]